MVSELIRVYLRGRIRSPRLPPGPPRRGPEPELPPRLDDCPCSGRGGDLRATKGPLLWLENESLRTNAPPGQWATRTHEYREAPRPGASRDNGHRHFAPAARAAVRRRAEYPLERDVVVRGRADRSGGRRVEVRRIGGQAG